MTPKTTTTTTIFRMASKTSFGCIRTERPSCRMRSRSTSLDAAIRATSAKATTTRAAEAKPPGTSSSGSTFSSSAASPTSTVSSSVSPPPPPPLLMLEYSDFYVSSEGVTRTLYHHIDTGRSIEEIYNLTKATKTYMVRHPRRNTTKDTIGTFTGATTTTTVARIACAHLAASLTVQEIDHGIDSFGTGAVTWETSIAASLYMNRTACDNANTNTLPVVLRGHVLELGCGVGVGGILNICWSLVLANKSNGNHCHAVHSLTLTDGQDEVLRQCRLNVDRALASLSHLDSNCNVPSIYVSKLDWNEYMSLSSSTEQETTKKYHTVIACDCTYRLEDVAPLCRTAISMLHSDASSRIHLFSPHNRGAVRDVIRYLREELGLCLTVQLFAAERCRLAPGPYTTHRVTFHEDNAGDSKNAWDQLELDQCMVVANTKALFIHIEASRAITVDETRDVTISDID